MMLGIAVLMFAAIEGGLSAAFYVRRLWHSPDPNFRAAADTYSDRLMASQYYRELDAFEQGRTMRWSPFVYWRRVPYQSKSINITADGLRRTSNYAVGSGRTTKIFMFGGSTLWGLGAEDDSTIPSLLAKENDREGIKSEIVNFGQYAYVSTQGVIELVLQLQKGNIPDVVIFYDGMNDTFGAFQLGVPGLPYEEYRRELEFNLSMRKDIIFVALRNAIKGLSTVRFVDGALKRSGLRRDNIQSIPLEYEKPLPDKHVLARAVVDTYFGNMKLVQALSKAYGFTFISYWQPVIYQKEYLTDYERRSIALDVDYPGMKDFYVETYAYLRQRAAPMMEEMSFHDISSIFAEVREPIYVDFNHMGHKGNRLIAQRMAGDLVRAFTAKNNTVRRIEASE